MTIDLHIDELVLRGFARADRRAIAAAIECELARLFGERGAPAAAAGDDDIGRIDGGSFNVRPGASAATIGSQIAQAVHGAVSRG